MELQNLKATIGKMASALQSAATSFRSSYAGETAAAAPPPTQAQDSNPTDLVIPGGPLKREGFDAMANWMTGQGGIGDPATASQYLYSATLVQQQIVNICRVSWLARKIVWKKPKDTFRAGYNLIWEGSGEKSGDKGKKLRKGEKPKTPGAGSTDADRVRYAIQQKWNGDAKMIEAIAMARQFGGSVIVIGIKGQKLEDPMPMKDGKIDYSVIKKGGLQSLQVWDRWRANHDGEMDGDPDSPNRGKPMFHMLSSDGSWGGQRVHWSRVLRFDGDKVDWFTWRGNACWDDSVLQVLMDDLKQYDSITSAISALVPKSLRDIIFAKNAAKAASTAEGEASMSRRYGATARIASMWNVSVYDMENEKHEQRTFNFAGLDKIWEKSMVSISGSSGYPVTVLFGDEPSGLAATGDASQRNYYNEIEAERTLVAAAQHAALVECIVRNELGDLPPGFQIEYRPLWQPTATELATINKAHAEADHLRIDDGVITPGLAMREAKELSFYKTATQEDVDLAELAPPTSEDDGDDTNGDKAETDNDGDDTNGDKAETDKGSGETPGPDNREKGLVEEKRLAKAGA
jgi:hypothetical protein